MSKHCITAGLALLLMVFATISWAACTCDMPDVSSAGHHHQVAHHGEEHAAGMPSGQHSEEPCPHDCPEAKAVRAVPTVDTAMVLASSGSSVPVAVIPARVEPAFAPQQGHAFDSHWQTGPPYLKRTPVQLSTLMLN